MGERRDTEAARGDGGCLATSRGARPAATEANGETPTTSVARSTRRQYQSLRQPWNTFRRINGLPGVLKLSNSDSRKASALMKFASLGVARQVTLRNIGMHSGNSLSYSTSIGMLEWSYWSRPPWSGARSTRVSLCVGGGSTMEVA